MPLRARASPTSAATVRPKHLAVVVGLAIGPAIALGFARFSYALLVPAMRSALDWSYAEAGIDNAANAAGYVIGALAAAPLATRLGNRRTYMLGLSVTVAALIGSGLTDDAVVLGLLRGVAGAAGALPFVTGAALAAAAGTGGTTRPALALGIYFGGAGGGMVVAAAAVPAAIAAGGWRAGWLTMGAIALLAMPAARMALRHTPSPAAEPSTARHRDARSSPRPLLPLLVSYVCFGLGYIVYTTFIVAWLRAELGFDAREICAFWAGVGLAASFAGLAWGPVLARTRGGLGVTLANAAAMAGVVLPVYGGTRAAAYASALLFGGSFLIVPTAVTAFIRKAAPPAAWTRTIALFTTAFAIGQCLGPIAGGRISDTAHGLGDGLILSGGLLAVAALSALAQREPGPSGLPANAN
jgi:predicted MFS family arabinose efflux permease